VYYFLSIFWILIRIHFAATNVAGKVGKGSYLENKASVLRTLGGIKEEFDIYFERDDIDMGIPGAFYVTNRMSDEFFLVSLTLEYPDPTSDHDQNNIHFVCNSWVHNNHKTGRIFFANIVSQIITTICYFHSLK